jgi:CBS domain-containing protein/ribosome-associated translation inhibitor RaiA
LKSLKASRVDGFKSKPIIVSSSSPISEVMGILQHKNAYEVFIQERDKVSMITVREILKASDISMRASSLMFYVPKLSPSDTVGKAARLMNDYRLRALPIVSDGTIEGAVTTKSLCRALLSIRTFRSVKIGKAMTRKPITIDKEESVSNARSIMLKNGIDHLPVLDSGILCGIILSNQIVLSMFPREGLERGAFVSRPSSYLDTKVSGMMDSNVLVCDPKERASAVLKRMIEHEKTYYIVHHWHEVQGIVTYRDFAVFLAEPEKLDIPAYIMGLPDDPFVAQLAKIKFMRNAKALRKVFPKIEEIRSTVKTKDVSGDRCRYEVNVLIRAAGKVHIYSQEGWDLPSIFDLITDKMMRLLTKKRKKWTRDKRKFP